MPLFNNKKSYLCHFLINKMTQGRCFKKGFKNKVEHHEFLPWIKIKITSQFSPNYSINLHTIAKTRFGREKSDCNLILNCINSCFVIVVIGFSQSVFIHQLTRHSFIHQLLIYLLIHPSIIKISIHSFID